MFDKQYPQIYLILRVWSLLIVPESCDQFDHFNRLVFLFFIFLNKTPKLEKKKKPNTSEKIDSYKLTLKMNVRKLKMILLILKYRFNCIKLCFIKLTYYMPQTLKSNQIVIR